MQAKFAQEYLIDQNAYQAAIRAGYSENTAYSEAHALVEHPEIKPLIAHVMEKQADELEITAERVLKELAKIAFTERSAFFDDDGTLLPLSKIPKDALACLVSIETSYDKHGNKVKKPKLIPRTEALDKLGKHLKLFNDTVDINITVGLAERLAAARNRVDNKPMVDVTPVDDGNSNE